MKKLQLGLLSLLISVTSFAQIPSLIEVGADNWESWYQGDFKNVLGFVAQGADTVLLTSGGFVYTTSDTFPLLINSPVVIMAAPGLTEKPILTHSNPNLSTSMEIFRITDDVEFHGIAFEGALDQPHGLKYALRYGDFEDTGTGMITLGKTDVDITVKDCSFNNFHSEGDQNLQGNAFYFLKPIDITNDHLRAHKILIENCMFTDIGDEAIRISEGEKYPFGSIGTVAYDTLIVRDCTFDDIDAECIRIYGDTDTSFAGPTYVDGLTLIENVTAVNCSPRFIYAKNYRQTIVRDVLVAHGRGTSLARPERGDFVMQIQLSSSYIAHIDTFDLLFTMYYDKRIGATKGGWVDTNSVYGFDPLFADFANGNYEAQSSSPLYWTSSLGGFNSNGGFIGDRRWATDPPAAGINSENKPERFQLGQNYPNPFNPSTTINFSIERPDFTTLKVFNVRGQVIATLKDGFLMDGKYSLVFNASDLSNGVYFYELRQGQQVQIQKMILLK
ncbi:MAG: T9SS type A sorting domain-containing protein [Candidatus Marinimicrobia bacterium]|nr:T9SS type A sorting domain-containing protein [Candidatus Neomarinimicrobiota bacterium]